MEEIANFGQSNYLGITLLALFNKTRYCRAFFLNLDKKVI